jgi:hypothetical protein
MKSAWTDTLNVVSSMPKKTIVSSLTFALPRQILVSSHRSYRLMEKSGRTFLCGNSSFVASFPTPLKIVLSEELSGA